MIVRRKKDSRSITNAGINIEEVPELSLIANKIRDAGGVEITRATALLCKEGNHNKVYYIVTYTTLPSSQQDTYSRSRPTTYSTIGCYGPNTKKGFKKIVDIEINTYQVHALSVHEKTSDDKRKKKYIILSDFADALIHVFNRTEEISKDGKNFIDTLISKRS